MKTIKRRAFCKAAAAAVAGVLAPHAAAEALLPQAAQAVVGSSVPEDYYSFAFRSDHSETDLSHDFYYTDAFFENTALQYSHKLALATLGLVAASGNTYQSDALYWVEGEAGREDSIADAYQKLGFANAVYAGYQCSLNTPVDTAGCAFAQKTLVQDGQRTTIIAAMLRGVGYGAEWASNLHVGEGGGHYGFVTAAEHFFEDLQDYLKKAEAAAGTLGTIKLWLGGYSRGAAVANLTAARIRQQLPYIGDVTVQRGLPSTLTFTVKEWAAAAQVEVYADPEPAEQAGGEEPGDQSGEDTSGETAGAAEEQGTAATVPWLINAAGKLLEEAGEDSGAIPVTGLTILSPRAGEQMAVPQSQQERLETLKKLLSALERAGMLEQVGSIDLTHSTWISMVYRERFEARIPLDKDLDHSLGVLALAVEDTVQTRGEQAAGIMDLTQEEYDAAFTPASG